MRDRSNSRSAPIRRIPLALVLGALLVAASAATPSLGQDSKPPAVQDEGELQLSATLVTVTMVVRDSSGALARGLTREDFTVTEDGVPQEIDAFYRDQELPLQLALLFDTSLSVRPRLDFERRAASRFFSSVLRASDRASLVSVSSDWRLEQALTHSVDDLVRATSRLEAAGITSLHAAIHGAAGILAAADGRRVMVVLSDGYDTAGKATLREALERAHDSNVVIYGISPDGTEDDVNPASRLGREALRVLCEQTGGVAFFPTENADAALEATELDAIYTRIAEELRAQYVLTYYSSASAHDGSFRRLHVTPKRPGLTVTARKGYYAR